MLPSGKWSFIDPLGGAIFNQIGVAKKWGILPSELGICEEQEDLLLMTAYTRIDNLMQGWDNHIANKNTK